MLISVIMVLFWLYVNSQSRGFHFVLLEKTKLHEMKKNWQKKKDLPEKLENEKLKRLRKKPETKKTKKRTNKRIKERKNEIEKKKKTYVSSWPYTLVNIKIKKLVISSDQLVPVEISIPFYSIFCD